MQEHLEGRRHCDAVARRFFGFGGSDVPPSAAAAKAIFEAHSVLPLSSTTPDPPDVALMLLHQALGELGAAEAASPAGSAETARLAGAAEAASPAGAAPRCAEPDAAHSVSAGVLAAVGAASSGAPEVVPRHGPRPAMCTDKPWDSPTSWCGHPLPAGLRREDTLRFCTARHDLRGAAIEILATPRKGIGTFGDARPRLLEGFMPHADVFRRFKARQALYREVGKSAWLLDAYEALLARVVLPHLCSRLGRSEGQRTIFYYQFPPTLRVQPGLSEEHGPMHCDAEYGHQPGELNFWMPLTSYPKTGTTLHVESEPGAGAWAIRLRPRIGREGGQRRTLSTPCLGKPATHLDATPRPGKAGELV
jgi:hypothetical protein